MRTNAVFSRIVLVSCFCAEIQFSGKILENPAKILFYQKTHGARIRYEEGLGGHHTTWWRGPSLVAPGCGEATPAASLSSPSTYKYPLTWNYRGFDRSETAIRNQKLRSGTLPGRGFGGDLHHHHHRHLSINHPRLPHPCVSNSRCRRRGW
jgi:hypothetical protein